MSINTIAHEPAQARPIFSNEDFALLRTAVQRYLQTPEGQDGIASIKYGNLYHRLGRLG